MNSIERIMATLQGNPTDRRAISLLLSLYGARLTDCRLSEYYTDAEAYARGQSAVRETFQPDILFAPFAFAMEGAAFGGRVMFLDNAPPNLARPAIASADDVDQLAIPDVDSHPQVLYFREVVRRMSAEHGDEVPVAAIAAGPVDLPAMILGIEGWMETLLFDEDGAKRMLEISIPYFVRRANAMLADGAMFVVISANFANPSIVTRDIVTNWSIPALREALARIEGPVVIHSGGAPLAPYIDLFRGLPNVKGFVLNGKESFEVARQKLGPEPLLLGNIEGPGLFLREREEIMADCLAVLRDRCHDPRFALATSMSDIGFDTPPENIHVFREAVESLTEVHVL